MTELIALLTNGGWVAFAGFGIYLGYKLALTTVISFATIKIIGEIVNMIAKRREYSERFMQVITAAEMIYPLTSEEWEELIKRVRRH